jgi:hypothetical protein
MFPENYYLYLKQHIFTFCIHSTVNSCEAENLGESLLARLPDSPSYYHPTLFFYYQLITVLYCDK